MSGTGQPTVVDNIDSDDDTIESEDEILKFGDESDRTESDSLIVNMNSLFLTVLCKYIRPCSSDCS